MERIAQFPELGDPGGLRLIDAEPPVPAPGEVQIAMTAAGLNRAELLFMAGQYLVEPVLPSPIDFDGAGDVVAVGEGVEGFRQNDRVAMTPAFKQGARARRLSPCDRPYVQVRRHPESLPLPRRERPTGKIIVEFDA